MWPKHFHVIKYVLTNPCIKKLGNHYHVTVESQVKSSIRIKATKARGHLAKG